MAATAAAAATAIHQQQPTPTAASFTSATTIATTTSNPTSPSRSTHTVNTVNTATTNATTTTAASRARTQSNTPRPLIVRALYDYHSQDSTNLSFQAGQLIRVLTQLQSGWWDGCIDGERGWFPCNFVTEVDSTHLAGEDFLDPNDSSEEDDVDVDETESGDESIGEQVLESAEDMMAEEYAWVPQADKDGRTFYVNTQNGSTSWELPGTRVFLDDWEENYKISDDDEDVDDDDGHPRSSLDSENSEDILMLGPIQDYPPDLNVLFSHLLTTNKATIITNNLIKKILPHKNKLWKFLHIHPSTRCPLLRYPLHRNSHSNNRHPPPSPPHRSRPPPILHNLP